MLEHLSLMPLAQLDAPAPRGSTSSAPAPAPVAGSAPAPEIRPAPAPVATSTMPDMGVAGLPAPGDLTIAPQGSGELLVTWKDLATGETGYHVARSPDGTTFTALPDLPKDSTSFKDTGLATNAQYAYKVSAFNAAGDGGVAVAKGTTANSFFGQFGGFLPIVLIVGMLYLFLFRGQRKEAKKKKEMMAELKKGDKVMTIGGMVARVVSIDGDDVVLKVDESANVKATYRKSAIQEVLDRDDKK
jgi:preprotein translocase subunit YajC